MKAAVLRAPKTPLAIEEVSVTNPGDLDSLIAEHIALAGINEAIGKLRIGESARSVIMFD